MCFATINQLNRAAFHGVVGRGPKVWLVEPTGERHQVQVAKRRGGQLYVRRYHLLGNGEWLPCTMEQLQLERVADSK